MRRFLCAFAITAALLPGLALAHARLVSATPPVGGIVAAAPVELVLRFTEAPEPRFSSVTVTAADGARVDRDDLHPGAEGPKTLAIGLGRMAPGIYTVRWQITSVDTHRTEGSFRFTVAP